MSNCPTIGTIRLDGQDVVVICDLGPHDGDQHHDVVHNNWASEGEPNR
jgi:hypothetical protein